MKDRTFRFSHLAIAALAALPAVAIAAIPATAPYNTDRTNAYVQDQTSNILGSLNNILCYVGAMDPAEMVGQGNYIALVDKSICDPNSGGGRGGSTNTGANYEPAIVNVSRASTSAPMIAKVWIDQPGNGQAIFAYLSATQAPNPPTDPYGRFRLDYCGQNTTSKACTGKGFINSTAAGLEFFQNEQGNNNGSPGTYQKALLLNSTSSTAGSGKISESFTPTVGAVVSLSFTFAYDANNFVRNDGVTTQCFDRNPANAAESVWSYGLYDATTGARIERNSGFPIEYTDVNGAVMNGFVGYWGFWAPTAISTTNKTVNQITYSNTGATKTPYTLLQTGGKLTKYTKVTKTLAQLDKVRFQFWPQATAPAVGAAVVTVGTGYEVYWDNVAGNFKISGQQDPVTWNMVPLATPVVLSIANMQTASPWGIYGWSQMLGGSFAIPQNLMATLSAATNVTFYTQDIVYPSSFAATFPAGLICIENCPTLADINASNGVGAAATTLPYAAATTGWVFNTGRTPYTYTLNATTGNLVDATVADVVSTAMQTSGTTGNYGSNNFGIRSGRLAVKADLDANTAVTGRVGFVAGTYLPVDFDQLTTYYEWETGGNNWNQLSVLKDATTGNPVVFDPPLNVDWTIPATGAQYGGMLGATISLQYGGFGDLWGIPSTCVDITTNAPCTFAGAGATLPADQRWTPQFSIPSGSTVTVGVTQGTVTAGTTYLVKALEKEVRLANVACGGITLVIPGTAATATLPTQATWVDTTLSGSATYVGAAPTFATKPAPRVIHGVKKY